jgi:cell division septation protein DedD
MTGDMTGDWRKLALAAAAAIALAANGAPQGAAQAQTPGKAAAKKAPANDADGEAEGGPAKPKRQDPVEAEHAITAALQQLEAGKSAEAAQALTRVLNGGGLPPVMMAKALLYRGIAYRQQKKPAQAIADLTSALWLKGGLSEADRADALRQRAAAYQEAGLADSGDPMVPAVPNAARGARTASVGASPEAAPSAPPSSSGWPNPFAGWFGGAPPAPSRPPQPPPEPSTTASIETPPQAHPAPRSTSPSGAKTSSWTSETNVRGSPGPAAESVAAAKPEGRFRIQLGMLRTEAEAQALSARVKREHPDALGPRAAEIDETVVGNMGSFYRVRVGPFASAQEGQAACAKLKGAGIDCLLVTP